MSAGGARVLKLDYCSGVCGGVCADGRFVREEVVSFFV